ncbi:GFA family protein [Pyruvatibacter mobilis]|uniref:GFA family protein n=1 Tax=Pyruvatibacter mobilis TaxID=1712261 RepID=UPI003BAB8A4E
MIEGSCCCGAVRFELANPPSMMGMCHCSRCRKVGASAMVFIKKADLTWVSGRDNVAVYAPEAPYQYARCFCKTCGTSLGEILSEEDSFPISAHTLDTPLEITNTFHEFVAEKPTWSQIGDDAKQFDGHPTAS